MSKRCVVSVATGRYRVGQTRLKNVLDAAGETGIYFSSIPSSWPPHDLTPGLPQVQGGPVDPRRVAPDGRVVAVDPTSVRPYAFKAMALRFAADKGYTSLLWADACIVPIKPLAPLWERIERDGAWISNNGFTSYEWCADSAYPELFPDLSLDDARAAAKEIPHPVATCFGLNLLHATGRFIFDEYVRLAMTTRAFCGPWMNSNHTDYANQKVDGIRCAPCGPSDVRGHRHDQVVLGIIANRAGVELTDGPNIFAYGKLGDPAGKRTILLADGNYA